MKKGRSRKTPWAWVIPAGVLLAACSAWLWGHGWWITDLAANLASLFAVAAGAFSVCACVRRRFLLALTGVCAGGVGVLGLMATPRLASAGEVHASEQVRVVVFNGSSGRLRHPEAAYDMLLASNADVVVLIEPSTELLDLIRGSASWTERYPYRRLPESARAGWRVVLTRWPQRGGEDFAGGAESAASRGMHVMVIERPGGVFGFVQFNPESPRSVSRWRRGNMRVEEAIDAITERLLPLEIPVIAAGDMNATGSGGRSVRFARMTGLKRAKPWWLPAATFPVWPGGVVGVAIDDVWASGDVRLVSWERLDACGSDHRPVLVTLAMPGRVGG
ncbi:MAG: endonuclease/exonuclease/phosphatase family protein [Phycisphaeraceae bacterium]|nr:endonuclease/exonuclease/phosphatase family protein [Phycisphaeraceae bacterium]